MPDTNDQFDLPRWHTSHKLSENTSPAYFYPQNSANNLSHTDPHSALARSASFSGPSSTARGRRHSLLTADSDSLSMATRQPQTAFYPPPASYHNQPPPMSAGPPPSSAASDSYPDMYYNPKRIQPPIDPNPQANRSGRSPMRVPNTPSLLDPYAQQAQYSPTTQYSYGPPQPQTQYQHNRNISHPKHEPNTPPIPQSYTSPPSAHPGPPYASPFAMDTTSSPHPSQSQTHLSAQASSRTHSISNPSTPLSYMHPSQSAGPQYYSQEQQMAVDPPPKRRASGFRRVRTVHDLQPRVDSSSVNRRVTADGIYLSVRFISFQTRFSSHFHFTSTASTATDYASRRDISHLQSSV